MSSKVELALTRNKSLMGMFGIQSLPLYLVIPRSIPRFGEDDGPNCCKFICKIEFKR